MCPNLPFQWRDGLKPQPCCWMWEHTRAMRCSPHLPTAWVQQYGFSIPTCCRILHDHLRPWSWSESCKFLWHPPQCTSLSTLLLSHLLFQQSGIFDCSKQVSDTVHIWAMRAATTWTEQFAGDHCSPSLSKNATRLVVYCTQWHPLRREIHVNESINAKESCPSSSILKL